MNRVKYEGQINGHCYVLIGIEAKAHRVRNKFNFPYRTLIYVVAGAKGQGRSLHVFSRGRNCLFRDADEKWKKDFESKRIEMGPK